MLLLDVDMLTGCSCSPPCGWVEGRGGGNWIKTTLCLLACRIAMQCWTSWLLLQYSEGREARVVLIVVGRSASINSCCDSAPMAESLADSLPFCDACLSACDLAKRFSRLCFTKFCFRCRPTVKVERSFRFVI